MSGLAGLLDRLMGRVGPRPPRSDQPVVEILQGE
jgi:hypothetical protein